MFIFKPHIRLVKSLVVLFFCFFLTIPWFSSFTQQTDCLTLQKILDLLGKKIEQQKIIEQVEKYGVDFNLDNKISIKLVRANASDSLLAAIERHYCAELTITSPTDSSEHGEMVRVRGNSRIISGKFLWVLAHRTDLGNEWWPQVSAIKPDSRGNWSRDTRIGEKQDIGSYFEIKAIWVDSLAHRELNGRIDIYRTEQRYPGIALPEGSPSTSVIVKRSH